MMGFLDKPLGVWHESHNPAGRITNPGYIVYAAVGVVRCASVGTDISQRYLIPVPQTIQNFIVPRNKFAFSVGYG